MITIITKTLLPTDTKPTRIIARFGGAGWGGKTSTIQFDHAANFGDNHFNAARKLWAEWSGDLDADYLGAGDLHPQKQVHLLNPYFGEVYAPTGKRGGHLTIKPAPLDKS